MTNPTGRTLPAGPPETERLQSFSMPDVGEGLTEAEILDWRVAVGDSVTVNQVIVEIETAKAAVELPCPFTGRVHELLVEPGVTVAVGTPIITVDTDPDAGSRPPGRRRTPRRPRPRQGRLHRRSRPHVPRVPAIPATTARRRRQDRRGHRGRADRDARRIRPRRRRRDPPPTQARPARSRRRDSAVALPPVAAAPPSEATSPAEADGAPDQRRLPHRSPPRRSGSWRRSSASTSPRSPRAARTG